MSNRHRVFVSYHHANDELYKISFEQIFSDYSEVIISRSVQLGDIDPNLQTDTIRRKIRDEFLRDSTVTVVLVGSETWKRKHVDWEIGSSIRDTQYNSRSGLLGIILPTYPRQDTSKFNRYTVPPRLWDNIECNYAKMYNWTTNPDDIQKWVHEAFLNRTTALPTNSRSLFACNRTTNHWQ